PDFSTRPRLRGGPLDAIVEIRSLARREMIDIAGRAAAAAGIHPDNGVTVRHPFLRIDHLPVLIQIARAGRDVRMILRHALPRRSIHPGTRALWHRGRSSG